MPPNPQDFRQGAKAYRNGFLIGALLGITICLLLQRTIWTLPMILGLICGAISINTKMK